MHPLCYTASRTPEDGVLIQSTLLADWGFFVAGGVALLVGYVFARDVFRELRYARRHGDLGPALWREKQRILKGVLPFLVAAGFAIDTGFKVHGYHRTLDASGLTIGKGPDRMFYSWANLSRRSERINSEKFWLEFSYQGKADRIELDQLILKVELQDHMIQLVQQKLSPPVSRRPF
jgi:hypothetical protein